MIVRQIKLEELINDVFFKILNSLEENDINNVLTINREMAKKVQFYRNYALYQVNYSSLKKAPTYHDKLDVIRSFNFFNRDYHLLKITAEEPKKLSKIDDSYKRRIEFLDDNIPYCIYKNNVGRKFKDIATLDMLLMKDEGGENFIFKNRNNQLLLDKFFQYFNDKSLPDKLKQLHLCVIFNQINLVKQQQTNFTSMIHSTESDEGKTALHMAAIYGYADWIPLLIEMGAEVNYFNRLGQTAILLAARYGHEHVVQTLIEKGANLHIPDGASSTPLHWAAKNNHASIVNLLITNKADTAAKGTYQKTPVHLAAENGSTNAFNMLASISKNQLKFKDKDRNEPIHVAAKSGHESIIHIIATIDFENLLTKNYHDKTPLELAWQNQQIEAVVSLLGYPSHTADDVNALIVNNKKIGMHFIMNIIIELESRNNVNLTNWIQFFKQYIIESFTTYLNLVKKDAANYIKEEKDILSSEENAATYYCHNKIYDVLQSKRSINLRFDAIVYFYHMISIMRLSKANVYYSSENSITWPELFEPYFKVMVHKAEQEEKKNTLSLCQK